MRVAQSALTHQLEGSRAIMMTLPTMDELVDLFALEAVKGFGPQKFKELHASKIDPASVLTQPRLMDRFGKRGTDFADQLLGRSEANRDDAHKRARRQLEAAEASDGAILTYSHPLYPPNLYDSNLPLPVLYARGDLSVLTHAKAVACVGSRKIRPPYSKSHDEFAERAISKNFAIISGFATGADVIGHLAARRAGGSTVCVMPSGLDRPFPPEHKDIWREFTLAPGVVFVSEFGFGVGANALNLKKRNKMIVAMARGVLVSQSTETGGAMNAYRFAMEQRKPVATFTPDGTEDTSGNDLIMGSAERVRATVLPARGSEEWDRWLRTL